MSTINQIRTKNFNPEFDKNLLCTCGHPKCDKRSVSQEHLNRVQKVRKIVGHALPVSSGGRCPYHPVELHRTTPADHQKRNGVDVVAHGSTRGNIVKAGIEAGCNAFGVAKTFVHLGHREEIPEGEIVMWVY